MSEENDTTKTGKYDKARRTVAEYSKDANASPVKKEIAKLNEEKKKRSSAGKGDDRRPCSITNEEYGLRYELATGRITLEEFEERVAALKTEQGEE